MLHSENAPIIPNRFLSDQEQLDEHAKRKPVPFKDLSNRRPKQRTVVFKADLVPQEQEQMRCVQNAPERSESRKSALKSRKNMIVEFDDTSEEEEPQSEEIRQEDGLSIKSRAKDLMSQRSLVPSKNPLLLDFDDSESQVEELAPPSAPRPKQQEEDLRSKQTQKETSTLSELKKGELVLSFDSRESLESGQQQESEEAYDGTSAEKRRIISLGRMMNDQGEFYYKKPVPEGKVLRCVVKRQKAEDSALTRYFFYDPSTLSNFMSVIKDEEGYSIISRYESESLKNLNHPRKQRAVAKITSNFFGTEFNCYETDQPVNNKQNYKVDTKTSPQLCTIEYETNFFGLTGPRKMTAFMPQEGHTFISKRKLNEIHQKNPNGIAKFKNKCPKWCDDIEAYVLNFHGRASISSVKNFIMIKEEEDDEAYPRVLFGKFGKELFNLDVRYPFSLVQAVALAISSFDRKLACQ